MDICDIVMNFYRIFLDFQAEAVRYKSEQKYNFEKINDLGPRLYHLKNAVHDLASSVSDVGVDDLFDLIVGSIFHEMLHLKEYIYVLQSYEPRYAAFSKQAETRKLAEPEKDFLRHSLQIVDEAKLGLPEKTKELEELYRDALHLLEAVLRYYRENDRLIRCILLEKELFEKMLGDDGVAGLFEKMFDSGAIEGFCRAGENFLKSGFHKEAVSAFDEAIARGNMLVPEDVKFAEKQVWLEKAKVNSVQAQLNV